MACYKPLKGYRSRVVNPETGRRSIVFNVRQGDQNLPLDVPCGQCIGCRLERSRQWAMRCVHEASLHERNCFITLTYRDECLPLDGSLVLKDFQDFMKRLRKKYGAGIRFFHCGEYGEKFSRPHYHACLFNFDFPDKVLFRDCEGAKLYVSESLAELWCDGFSTIGDVTFESAAYVARYVTKKITGDKAEDHYGSRVPEYTTMSRRPGIGRGWYLQYRSDVYPSDEVVLRGGRSMKPPKAYDRYFEVDFPDQFKEVRFKRVQEGKKKALLEPWYRLGVREECQELAFKRLKRSFEDGL